MAAVADKLDVGLPGWPVTDATTAADGEGAEADVRVGDGAIGVGSGEENAVDVACDSVVAAWTVGPEDEESVALG